MFLSLPLKIRKKYPKQCSIIHINQSFQYNYFGIYSFIVNFAIIKQ